MQRCRSQHLLKAYSRKPHDSNMMTDFLMVWWGLLGAPFCFQMQRKAEILMPLSVELCFVCILTDMELSLYWILKYNSII